MGTVALTGLSDARRHQAMARFEMLRPCIDDGIPLSRAARDAGVALRTAQRWLSRYRASGLAGLARTPRSSVRRTDPELVRLIEALALGKPRRSLASITRRAAHAAAHRAGHRCPTALSAESSPRWTRRCSLWPTTVRSRCATPTN